MTQITARLLGTGSLPELLSVSFDTFEAIRLIARSCEDREPTLLRRSISPPVLQGWRPARRRPPTRWPTSARCSATASITPRRSRRSLTTGQRA